MWVVEVRTSLFPFLYKGFFQIRSLCSGPISFISFIPSLTSWEVNISLYFLPHVYREAVFPPENESQTEAPCQMSLRQWSSYSINTVSLKIRVSGGGCAELDWRLTPAFMSRTNHMGQDIKTLNAICRYSIAISNMTFLLKHSWRYNWLPV